MAVSEEQIDSKFTDIDDLDRLAFVFRKLADESHAISLLIRYENSLTRTCDRAFKHLLAVQKLRNEPKPKPQEPVSTDPGGADFNLPRRLQPPSTPDLSPFKASESVQTRPADGLPYQG